MSVFVWSLCVCVCVCVCVQRLYKVLSDVKMEVETVIKTGRQIVQKQQTENPKGMDEQLTALKLLYNDLGAQVCVCVSLCGWVGVCVCQSVRSAANDLRALMCVCGCLSVSTVTVQPRFPNWGTQGVVQGVRREKISAITEN